jgi:hypothetical protein
MHYELCIDKTGAGGGEAPPPPLRLRGRKSYVLIIKLNDYTIILHYAL